MRSVSGTLTLVYVIAAVDSSRSTVRIIFVSVLFIVILHFIINSTVIPSPLYYRLLMIIPQMLSKVIFPGERIFALPGTFLKFAVKTLCLVMHANNVSISIRLASECRVTFRVIAAVPFLSFTVTNTDIRGVQK
jgi:hypothetical protein